MMEPGGGGAGRGRPVRLVRESGELADGRTGISVSHPPGWVPAEMLRTFGAEADACWGGNIAGSERSAGGL